MPNVDANGMSICYERHGEGNPTPVLLIMGLGAQLTAWPDGFVERLVAAGHDVVRFDNRDVGRSTYLDHAGVPDVAAYLAGQPIEPAYLLADLADDAAGLMEAIGWRSAHVVGASMGGMVAQELAIRHPHRVETLTSIMSTTGNPAVGQPTPEAMGALMGAPPANADEAVAQALVSWRIFSSPGFPFDEEEVARRARAEYERAFHPEGTLRQMTAIVSSPDRTLALGQLTMPVLVIHGDGDTLVTPSGGEATAAAIPGSSLWMVPGMGHDLPEPLWGDLVARIAAHVAAVPADA